MRLGNKGSVGGEGYDIAVLRRLELKTKWRSLERGFWPEQLPLGRKTVIYGHNGSGKSTLSELLLSLAEDGSAADVIWEHDDKRRTTVNFGEVGPSLSMAVFTRKWVDKNLSAFLDGASASAIVTLGSKAIEAKEEEKRLIDAVAIFRSESSEADKQREAAEEEADMLARAVQDRIVSQLRTFDYAHFTKNRYSVPKIEADLRNYEGEFPDSEAHAQALKNLGEDTPARVPEIPSAPVGSADKLAGLADLLADTPTRVAIETLEGNVTAQAWVERGLELHEGVDRCLFCAAEFMSERRAQLARHFDESWLQIRGRAMDLLSAITSEKQAITTWYSNLPATKSLAVALQPVYNDALMKAKVDTDERIDALAAVEAAVDAKIADPGATPEPPDWSVLEIAPSTKVLGQAVGDHNDRARRHSEFTSQQKQLVLDHLIGSQSAAFRGREEQAEKLRKQSEESELDAQQAERRLDEVRQAQFTTKDMADTLTRDLARVYGKDHLSVAVTDDGKSYACRRGDKPGTDLSHGERTTLSLLYFLRKLQDEQVPGGDPSQRIVVIDDPSSSLDREALFATHQWLIDTLRGLGQYVILTHDFSLLRLFIKSHRNAWGKSMKQTAEGNADEIPFPKVAFLEMYAASDHGERRSKVGKLPRVLLNNTSEYAYLFEMVMNGIADPEDHERLFLLPNAARRVLEVFASYKAPHLTNFLQALEVLVNAEDDEPYRDVYDFCNRFSHGEGSESVDILDARAVHGQIRRCMQFMRAADRQHFERMCSATGVSSALLP